MQPRTLPHLFFSTGRSNELYFFTTNKAIKITDSISCQSKNLIYLLDRKRCHLQYIRETKRQLNERFRGHRRSILNHQQLSITTPVSLHFNQAGHSINDARLIPIELIHSKRDSVRKAQEAHLINKARQLSITTPVSLHFNQAGHSITDVRLIPIELIHSKRGPIRKAREAPLINKAKTLHPFGINRRDEAGQGHT